MRKVLRPRTMSGGNIEKMTARKYFQQLWWLDDEINEKMKQLDELRNRAENCSAPEMTAMPRGSGTKDRLSDLVAKMVDLENYINDQTDRLIDLKAEITKQIDSMKDQRCRLILSRRYLRCSRQERAWEKIAKELHYDKSTLMDIHRTALKLFEEQHPEIRLL